MLGDGPLAFREFALAEPIPLARVHQAVFEFLRGRDDAVLFGAQAVNAWVDTARMTEDVYVMARDAPGLAAALRDHLAEHLGIAVRVRSVGGGRGLRLYPVRKTGNRHLVDIQAMAVLPPSEVVAGARLLGPAALVALKVMSLADRRGQPKAGTDWRDIAELLLVHPELKVERGPVGEQLEAFGAGDGAWAEWRRIVAAPLTADGDWMG